MDISDASYSTDLCFVAYGNLQLKFLLWLGHLYGLSSFADNI